MSVNTDGVDNITEDTTLPEGAPRQHVEENEVANGGLDLPKGEAKSDAKEAEREGHHEWNPDTGNQ